MGEDSNGAALAALTAVRSRPLIVVMPDSPRITRAKQAERALREARLADALRDNLRRRKDQARARGPESPKSDREMGPGKKPQDDDAPPA